jgi:hypothetical protein
MNKKIIMLIIILLALFKLGFSQDLQERIKSLPDIISVEKMEHNQFFEESLIIMVKQPLDHLHPENGSFAQRVLLSHLSYDEPVVLVTEGYAADGEVSPNYINELCPLLYANQIFVEHRYFGKSAPEPISWKYLTVENAAADHHHIAQIFKQLYAKKWISTGISKGGQATLYYRLLYPNDVAASVAYVAPLNFSVEDKRHDLFIRHKAGSSSDRKMVISFQRDLLKRKTSILPMFEKYCEEKKYLFKAPVSEIYDYCILEYSFSFWQWGRSVTEIPKTNSTDMEVFNYFTKSISPEYFDQTSGRMVLPFFVQALRELGYYAYNTRPFRRLMQLKDTRGYVALLFVPEEARFPYEPAISIRLSEFVKKEAKNILLLYGGNDPWTASAANTGGNQKILKIIQPGGCHLTRISTLPEKQHELALSVLKDWMRQN